MITDCIDPTTARIQLLIHGTIGHDPLLLQIIRQRFEDESSVFKSYDDAIHDIRVDLYLEGIKPRKQEAEESNEETAAKNAGRYSV